MNYNTYYSKIQGASHKKNGLVCQDSVCVFESEKYIIATVSDGHGSPQYFRSDRGSKFATEAAIECIEEFINLCEETKEAYSSFYNNPQKSLLQLEKSIIAKWYEKIEKDYTDQPFLEEDYSNLGEKYKNAFLSGAHNETAYGATLIAVAVTERYWFGIHIGDGKCVVCNSDKSFYEPIPWDEKCFLNVTTSMCDNDAIGNFRNFVSFDEIPKAIFIASDGIDSCFSEFDSNSQLYKFYSKVLDMFANNDLEFAEKELTEYLPILSKKGSKDDISLAMIFSLDDIINYFGKDNELMSPREEGNGENECEAGENVL